MKKLFLILFALMPFALRAQTAQTDSISHASGLAAGTIAPDFELTDTAGNLVNFKKFAARHYTVLDFWASWCPDCRKETPALKAFYQKYQSKGIKLMGVSFDYDRYAWKNYITDQHLNWQHVSDLKKWNSKAKELYKIAWIPTYVLVAPTGKIVASANTVAALEGAVRKYVK